MKNSYSFASFFLICRLLKKKRKSFPLCLYLSGHSRNTCHGASSDYVYLVPVPWPSVWFGRCRNRVEVLPVLGSPSLSSMLLLVALDLLYPLTDASPVQPSCPTRDSQDASPCPSPAEGPCPEGHFSLSAERPGHSGLWTSTRPADFCAH